MQLHITGSIDFEESASVSNDLLFLGFHGYSNDESEMVRIINAIYGADRCDGNAPGINRTAAARTNTTNTTAAHTSSAISASTIANHSPAAHHAQRPQLPNYLSFRGTYERPYIGSYYWYPDGCSVSERRHACTEIGNSVVKLLDAPVFQPFCKVLIGFSQGGYLSYRMVAEHPDVFDAAILLSPFVQGRGG